MIHSGQGGRVHMDRVNPLNVDRIGPLVAESLHRVVNRPLVGEPRDHQVGGSRAVRFGQELVECTLDQDEVAGGVDRESRDLNVSRWTELDSRKRLGVAALGDGVTKR